MKFILLFIVAISSISYAQPSFSKKCFDRYNGACETVRSVNGQSEIVTNDHEQITTLKKFDSNLNASLISDQEMSAISQGPVEVSNVGESEFKAYEEAYKAKWVKVAECAGAGTTCASLTAGGLLSTEQLKLNKAVEFFIAGYAACIITVATCSDIKQKWEDSEKARQVYEAVRTQAATHISHGGGGDPLPTSHMPSSVWGARGPGGSCKTVRGTKISDGQTTWESPPMLVCSSGNL